MGTDQWDDAIFISIERLSKHEEAARTGVPISTRRRREPNTVAEVAQITLARLRAERVKILATKESKKAHVFTAKISSIESKLIPAFGDRGIAGLTEDDMERFRLGLKVNGGQTPKRSTVANTNSAWLEILRDAIDSGFISRARKKMLVISQEGFEKGQRGDAFSRAEMQDIRTYMSDRWIADGHTQISRENRFLMRAKQPLGAGLRP